MQVRFRYAFFTMITRTLLASASVLSLLVACTPATPEQEESETMSMTFDQLLEQGDDFSCTFTEVNEGVTTSGTVYVSSSDERLYGDFQVMDGEMYDAHIIHDGTTTYIWTSEMAQGIRMEIGEEDSIFGDEETEDGVGIDDEQPVDFECDDWNVDESKFVPPSDVEFTDMAAMMQGLMQMGEMDMEIQGEIDSEADIKWMQCAACARFPDAAAKTQCEAALGC